VLAGAETQVMSLWKVDDAATRHLMVEYYQQLLTAKTSRAEALRKVQEAMLQHQQWQHPFFWASFIPSGAWTPLVDTESRHTATEGATAPPPIVVAQDVPPARVQLRSGDGTLPAPMSREGRNTSTDAQTVIPPALPAPAPLADTTVALAGGQTLGIKGRAEHDGLRIVEVMIGSPAEAGKLRIGDLITQVDGQLCNQEKR
jgi:hypothetical protein